MVLNDEKQSDIAQSVTETRRERLRRALPFLALLALVHLLVSWPLAGRRGLIAEEVESYLHHYPKLLVEHHDAVSFAPPYDDPELRRAVEEHRSVTPRWVGTMQWPQVAYHGADRIWPVFVRGHMMALGIYWGIGLGPLLGDGMVGVCRANALLGLLVVLLVWAIGRRVGLSRAWATVAGLGVSLCPGQWFFSTSGLAYEFAGRVLMIVALFVAAPRVTLRAGQAVLVGLAFAGAILCRAPIAASLAPTVLLLLVHPLRWASRKHLLGVLAIGGGMPILIALVSVRLLPFAHGTTPGFGVPIAEFAERTLNVPAFLAVQLAFLVDARVILQPLVEGRLDTPIDFVRPALGGAVFVAAMVRWWRAQAGDAERMLVGGVIGNTLVSAWIYRSSREFQLGMALQPVFVLAAVQQLAALYEWRKQWGAPALAASLLLRTYTLGTLASSERDTDSPMLSGHAQAALVEAVRNRGIAGDSLLTTAYNHVGLLEAWTQDEIRPLHAWPLLMASGVPKDALAERWRRLLDTQSICHVLITRGTTMYEGPFTDHAAVTEALMQALAGREARISDRIEIKGKSGAPVFEILTIAPCGRSKGEKP